MRISKIGNEGTTTYTVEGTTILAEKRILDSVETLITYHYGSDGIFGFTYNGTDYYYGKNLFGDIIDIYDASGVKVAHYAYDAWGNHTVYNGSGMPMYSLDFIGVINPFRYRGYYYDIESGYYYLQSRYYDPTKGRFLNADTLPYLGADGELRGYNLYTYCGNNPVMNADPTGHFWDVVFDIASIAWSTYDLITDPSWENAGWLALDIAFALVPFLTGSRLIKAASKLDEIAYVGKGINRLDNMYDTVVLGNDMNRVMDRAWDIGATFYGGYGPLNALSALHDSNSATDMMKYAAKLDNARFIIDKVNDGYKFVLIGSDGRSFIKMMMSAYGMELRVLYRLKFGNKIHKAWWLLNSARRVIW